MKHAVDRSTSSIKPAWDLLRNTMISTMKKRKDVTNIPRSKSDHGKVNNAEEVVVTVLAKLVQLNKSTSYMKKGKVKSGILEVLGGNHAGKKGGFQVGCCYVWGYHLADANLMYHLRSGEVLTLNILPCLGSKKNFECPA